RGERDMGDPGECTPPGQPRNRSRGSPAGSQTAFPAAIAHTGGRHSMSMAVGQDYGYRQRVRLTYDEAVAKVRDTLKEQGFGVLTEIDVTATLKQKLDVDFGKRYIILGACNPNLAYRALSAETELGLL